MVNYHNRAAVAVDTVKRGKGWLKDEPFVAAARLPRGERVACEQSFNFVVGGYNGMPVGRVDP